MLRLRVMLPLLVVGVLSSGFLMGEDKKTDKEPIIVKAQLPRYYKQLGLSNKQRTDIYKIRGKYAAEIQKLTEQIAALKAQEKIDLENILSAAQKARLKEITGGVDKSKETPEKPTEIKKSK